MAEPRIVGLDPSLTATGVAPSNLPQLRITYTITTKLRGCERLARAHHTATEFCGGCVAARVLDATYENPAPVADTGHTSKACTACGHHWDVHTPFRGCFTGCSCKLDPPNQPAPVATEATQEEDGRE